MESWHIVFFDDADNNALTFHLSFLSFSLKLGVIVVVISNQPHATRLAKLKHLANYTLYSIHFQTTCDPCNPFGSPQCTFLQIASFYGISFSQLHWNMTTNQISRLVDRNQSNCRKMRHKFCNFYKPGQKYWIKKLFVQKIKKTLYWATVFFFYLIEITLVISVKLAFRVREITWMVSSQTALHSIQLPIEIVLH